MVSQTTQSPPDKPGDEVSGGGITQKLYNANDGLTGRDGGPYLDIEEARAAEDRRAVVEGRDPDYDNMGSSAGIKVVTAAWMLQQAGVNNLPSQGETDTKLKYAEQVMQGIADDDTNNLQPIGELPPTEQPSENEDLDLSMRNALAMGGDEDSEEESDDTTTTDDSSTRDPYV